MAESTETIVKWLREQGDLYEEQGLSTDAEYGHQCENCVNEAKK